MSTTSETLPKSTETIGFIGLGNQGGPIAHRIVDAGLPLVVWARRPEALEPYIAKSARAAASIAELGAQCDHVGICVFSDEDVLEVCQQLVPAMRPSSRIAIHSTVLPDTCSALERQCADYGIALLDAPVSGGAAAAEAGTLTVMCGGEQTVFDTCKPIFETFCKLIVRVGGVGSGQHAKIINNALLAANIGLAEAALNAGEALGIDRATLVEVIRGSSGYSFGLEVCALFPTPVSFSGAALLVKDVGLLKEVLPGHAGTDALAGAADPYLDEATKPTTTS